MSLALLAYVASLLIMITAFLLLYALQSSLLYFNLQPNVFWLFVPRRGEQRAENESRNRIFKRRPQVTVSRSYSVAPKSRTVGMILSQNR